MLHHVENGQLTHGNVIDRFQWPQLLWLFRAPIKVSDRLDEADSSRAKLRLLQYLAVVSAKSRNATKGNYLL